MKPFYWVNVLDFSKLQPEEIKSELDKWIIGQDDAKIAIAVALSMLAVKSYLQFLSACIHSKGNRWRRTQVPEEIKKEIIPKNILMIGPSGILFLISSLFLIFISIY